MKVVAKLVQTVLLIAGLLWSGVCVAQCRVLPPQAAKPAQQSKKKLPPCHQQQEQAPDQEDCKDEGCSVSYADAEKSFQVDIAVSVPPASYVHPVVDSSSYHLILERRAVFTSPSQSISVLRI